MHGRTQGQALQPHAFDLFLWAAHCESPVPWEAGDAAVIDYCKPDLKSYPQGTEPTD